MRSRSPGSPHAGPEGGCGRLAVDVDEVVAHHVATVPGRGRPNPAETSPWAFFPHATSPTPKGDSAGAPCPGVPEGLLSSSPFAVAGPGARIERFGLAPAGAGGRDVVGVHRPPATVGPRGATVAFPACGAGVLGDRDTLRPMPRPRGNRGWPAAAPGPASTRAGRHPLGSTAISARLMSPVSAAQ
ncbi:hypothetical protein TNIN_93641, partial [Trichonephila inaurata madagascariensis]